MSEGAVASTSKIAIEIKGLRNQKGQICLSLFSQPEGFPGNGDRAVATQCIQASDIARAITFENLAPGSYAVSLFHDANSDGKLNTGFLGIPKEGFGFSQNPRIGTSAPRFRDAAFLLTNQGTKIQIQMKYF